MPLNQFTASLWGDEGFSAILSQKSIPEIVTILIRDTSPPGYYFFEHFWMKIFGTSEIAIRSLSFVLFLLTVFFVYKIGSFVWDRETGLAASLLTFLNPFLFIYAFEGRMYSIMAAFVTGSMYFFLKSFFSQKPVGPWPKLGYITTTTIALYSHHFAIFAIFVQGIWFLKEFAFGNRKASISIFKSLLVVGLLYLPWIYPLYLQTKMVNADFWLQTPTLKELWELVRKFLAEATPHKLATPSLYLIGATLLLRKWQKDKDTTLLLLTWFLLPLILTYTISQFFQSIFFDRYLLYTIPGATLILASNRRRISEALIAVTAILLVIINFFYFTHPTKLPFRDLANYVKPQRTNTDLLISPRIAPHYLWESKYYGIPLQIWVPEGKLPFFVGTALMTEKDIIKKLPQTKRIGVITSGNIEEINLPGYTRASSNYFGDLVFAWYLPQ